MLTVRQLREALAGYADEATVYVLREGKTEPARSVVPSSMRWSVIITDRE